MIIYFGLAPINTKADVSSRENQATNNNAASSQTSIKLRWDSDVDNILKIESVTPGHSVDPANNTSPGDEIKAKYSSMELPIKDIQPTNLNVDEFMMKQSSCLESSASSPDSLANSLFTEKSPDLLDLLPEICKGCGQLATKYNHYGGRSCGSCRAFFRRSVNKKCR